MSETRENSGWHEHSKVALRAGIRSLRNVREWLIIVGFAFLFRVAPAAVQEPAREFTVAAFNVEMLFDIDGVAAIDEYRAERWGAEQLQRKLANVAAVLQRIDDGRGPDIICFNELEADQTPESSVEDLAAFLRDHRGARVRDWLSSPQTVEAFKGLPSHVWLAKQLADDGLGEYHVATNTWRPDPTGRTVFHVNAVFSRFPVIRTQTHHTAGARGILEVQIDVHGRTLYVFNNHWKSGASDPETEPIRIGNAQVLRRRLDTILRENPVADVILAGDFNSEYNQKQRHPHLKRTAINDVLGSQGDEVAFARPRGPALYNLWFELPPAQRRSDEYDDKWGTLIQMLVTRGLYDRQGVQYVDNSFAVGAFPGVNAEAGTGRPVRWSFAGGGDGVSDHFPVHARFRVVADEHPGAWMLLTNPSRTPHGPRQAFAAPLALDRAIDLHTWPPEREFRTEENVGRLFRVRGRVTSEHPFRVRVDGPGVDILVWIRDRKQREAFFARHHEGKHVSFIGELGRYRGEWEFVIPAATLQ